MNSTQILGCILICLYFTTGHFHTRVLGKECSLFPVLILGSVFSDVSSFMGIASSALAQRRAVKPALVINDECGPAFRANISHGIFQRQAPAYCWCAASWQTDCSLAPLPSSRCNSMSARHLSAAPRRLLPGRLDIQTHAFLYQYDTRCYFNVRSKADISRLNLPHGNDN